MNNYESFTKDEIILQFEQSNNKFIHSAEMGPLDILVENEHKQKIFVKY